MQGVRLLGIGTQIFLQNLAGGTFIRVGTLIRHCIVCIGTCGNREIRILFPVRYFSLISNVSPLCERISTQLGIVVSVRVDRTWNKHLNSVIKYVCVRVT